MVFIRKSVEKKRRHAFTKVVTDIPNGGSLCIEDLTQPTLDEGTPVGFSSVDGLYHVIKTAKIMATASASAKTYSVAKGHNFKVGDIVALKSGGAAYAITKITTNTTNSDYDDIAVGTTLGAAVAGDVLFASSKTGESAAELMYNVVGLTSYDTDVYPNVTIGIVTIGQIYESKCPAIGPEIKAALPTIIFI